MHNEFCRNHRWASAGATALVLLAAILLPSTAGTSTTESSPNSRFAPQRWLERQGKTRNLKMNFGATDAWVAKYQAGPDGVRKVLWKRQLGSSTYDFSDGVATDSTGNVLITGATFGSLASTYKGIINFDPWVAKYSLDGTLTWKKQLGSSVWDESRAVATDSSGNVFITGFTNGSLGGPNKGDSDAWVAKYSPDGILVWIQQLGTSLSDGTAGVATDSSGNVYISGGTSGSLGGSNKGDSDAWVAKYSPSGTLKWIQQLGTSVGDGVAGVATDSSSNVYISGSTTGSLGGPNKGDDDAWVAKYSSNGTLKWKRQLGSSNKEYASGVAVDRSANVFITGYTNGLLGSTNKGEGDAWVAKYSSAGTLKWVQQLGTSGYDVSSSVAVDSNSNVFIAGGTSGSLVGTNKGNNDAWVAKFNTHGKQLWLRQDGTRLLDGATGVAVDSSGYVITTGETEGNFSGD